MGYTGKVRDLNNDKVVVVIEASDNGEFAWDSYIPDYVSDHCLEDFFDVYEVEVNGEFYKIINKKEMI